MNLFLNILQTNPEKKEIERKNQKFLGTFNVHMNSVKKHMEVKIQ